MLITTYIESCSDQQQTNKHCTTMLTKYSRSRKLGMGMGSNSLGIDTSLDVVDRHMSLPAQGTLHRGMCGILQSDEHILATIEVISNF